MTSALLSFLFQGGIMKKTVLYGQHVKLGAKMIDFNGFLMPVYYSSIIKEHGSVRNSCGIFDVSHMGEILVTGPEAGRFLQHLCTNNISRLHENDVMYTCICYEGGGTADDLLVYMLSPEKYLCVVNASNTEKDLDWFVKNNSFDAVTEDISDSYSQIAVQGPGAEALISDVFKGSVLPRFFKFTDADGYILSRTGYTGEDGFEIYMKNDRANALWEDLLEKGARYNVSPAGLGARDTLRFEACLPLYGHELSADISPLEAGLDLFVKLDKQDDFIGQKALKEISADKKRTLIGLKMTGRGIARPGHSVRCGGDEAGYVTSGSYCPTFDQNFAMALVKTQYAQVNEYDVMIRDNSVGALRVGMPFYKKKYRKTEV
jgi:aminomethyltransferase